jgi:hypothetical protein
MMNRVVFASLVTSLLMTTSVSEARRPKLLSVHVKDSEGKPIPNAWVRIPDTEGRRQVSSETGIWEASMLYRYDGDILFFLRGDIVNLTVSAPGYQAQALIYTIRPRRNEFEVQLQAMLKAEAAVEADEELSIEWLKAED